MGLSKNPPNTGQKQVSARRKRPRCTPRTRRCLLKGCEQSYRPRQARQRYCSGQCRKAARAWSRWKAQRRYRGTTAGQQKRNGQSRRYRERVRKRKSAPDEAVSDAARVITSDFFRCLLRPAWLLSGVRAPAAIPATTLLLAPLPARSGTCYRARTALASGARRLTCAAR